MPRSSKGSYGNCTFQPAESSSTVDRMERSFLREITCSGTTYVGAALADDIRQCDGLVDMMSFWTFSDVFEENGPKKEPFDGGFGLIAMGGIKKPSYVAFGLLHNLGAQRLDMPATDILVTRRQNGTLVIAAWNLVDPDQQGSHRLY